MPKLVLKEGRTVDLGGGERRAKRKVALQKAPSPRAAPPPDDGLTPVERAVHAGQGVRADWVPRRSISLAAPDDSMTCTLCNQCFPSEKAFLDHVKTDHK